ncbi:MAG: 30S ribosomal protein S6 [Chloroflexota bacterium]
MTTEPVVTAEEKGLRAYELVLVINPELMGDKLDATVGNVSQFITDRKGVITEVQRWGKKKMAYPIGGFTEANYILTRFKSKPALGKELEANLRIADDVLRHLLVKLD